MRPSAFFLLLFVGPSLAAQDSTGRVVGRVHTHATPLAEAQVSVYDDTLASSHAHVARTSDSGWFAIEGLMPGRHRLTVRRVGYRMTTRVIDVRPDSRDTVDIAMLGTREVTPAESIAAVIARADYARRLDSVRAHPRHWTCESRPGVVHQYAEQWVWQARMAANALRAGHKPKWGQSPDSATFVETFRPIVDADECARIGRALDKDYGQLSDSLTVFRMGDVYLVPTGRGTSMVLDLKGTTIAVYIVPN